MATSKQTSIHTHVHNAVPLVWGSFRLTATSVMMHLWASLSKQQTDLSLHKAEFVTHK